MRPFVVQIQPEVDRYGPFVVRFENDPSACTEDDVLASLVKQMEDFVSEFNRTQRIHLLKISITIGRIIISLDTLVNMIRNLKKIGAFRWMPVVNHAKSIMKILEARSNTLQDVQSPANKHPSSEELMSLKEAEERMRDVVRIYSARKIRVGQEPGILPRRVAGGLTGVEIVILRECEEKIDRERKHLVEHSEASEARLKKVAEDERRKLMRSGYSHELSSIRWRSSIGNHLMAVYDLMLNQRSNPDDIEVYVEKEADLYPKNWFCPHAHHDMVGDHEQTRDWTPEQVRSMADTNDGKESAIQGENSPAYSGCTTSPLRERGYLWQLIDVRNELLQKEQRIEALEIETTELKKKLAEMHKELKKYRKPTRRRKVCRKENAPKNSHIEQLVVLQPSVSKRGRQIKPSRRA